MEVVRGLTKQAGEIAAPDGSANADALLLCRRPGVEGLAAGLCFCLECPVGRESEMLVLSRKRNETIRIGNNVQVKILRISGNRVSLGIQAPKEIILVRAEQDKKDQKPRA